MTSYRFSQMATGSHIGFDLDNVRPPKRLCIPHRTPRRYTNVVLLLLLLLSAIVGLRLVLKFGLDRIHSFGDIGSLYLSLKPKFETLV